MDVSRPPILPGTGGGADPSVGRSSNESPGSSHADRPSNTARRVARLEPERELGTSNDEPATNDGDEGQTTSPPIATPLPRPEPGTSATPARQNRAQAPKGLKNTRATLTISSLNIRGGGSANTRPKWQHINQIMREKEIGILAVQETHLKQTDVDELNDQFCGQLEIINSCDPTQPNAKGVAFVLNNRKTAWDEASTNEIIPGRAISLIIPWQRTSRLNVLAIYAPNAPTENVDFWETLERKWLEDNLPVPDILLGDFNLVEEMVDRLPAHSDAQ